MAGGSPTRRGSSYKLAPSGEATIGRAMDSVDDVSFSRAVLIGALVIIMLGLIGGLA
jgi:hypothetical protein